MQGSSISDNQAPDNASGRRNGGIPSARRRSDRWTKAASPVNDNVPGPAPVLAAVLDELDEQLRKRMVMSEAERHATVLWIAHTYVYGKFKDTPRLLVTSAGPIMGKTELLSLVAAFSAGGEIIDGITPSSLKRVEKLAREKDEFTIALDQLDTVHIGNEKDAEVLNILCSSTKTGAQTVMSIPGEKGWVPTRMKIGRPTALGKIGLLPGDAIMSRAILIIMVPENSRATSRADA